MPSDADVKLLLSCLLNSNQTEIDFVSVARESSYTNPRSASNRLAVLKKRHNTFARLAKRTPPGPTVKQPPVAPRIPPTASVFSPSGDVRTAKTEWQGDHVPAPGLEAAWPAEWELMVNHGDDAFPVWENYSFLLDQPPLPPGAVEPEISAFHPSYPPTASDSWPSYPAFHPYRIQDGSELNFEQSELQPPALPAEWRSWE
ncbi:unnamed protein product [Tuber aestivum]|uniref:Myb-like DNA-binding domain-containing protein n=1 Tax=Tuber aestivum TaxID=59557 RepID=A0A292PN35_9PEZI|nr:unnamed protein product [Tuber aestivum]